MPGLPAVDRSRRDVPPKSPLDRAPGTAVLSARTSARQALVAGTRPFIDERNPARPLRSLRPCRSADARSAGRRARGQPGPARSTFVMRVVIICKGF